MAHHMKLRDQLTPSYELWLKGWRTVHGPCASVDDKHKT